MGRGTHNLSKEDWDTILELGIDDKKEQIVAKNISTAAKSTVTKRYKPVSTRYLSTGHKIPKKLARGPATDLEGAILKPYLEINDATTTLKTRLKRKTLRKTSLIKGNGKVMLSAYCI